MEGGIRRDDCITAVWRRSARKCCQIVWREPGAVRHGAVSCSTDARGTETTEEIKRRYLSLSGDSVLQYPLAGNLHGLLSMEQAPLAAICSMYRWLAEVARSYPLADLHGSGS